MKNEVANLVAVLPDGREYFGEIRDHTFNALADLVDKAVRAYGIKNYRSNPVEVNVNIYRLLIKNGEMNRVLVKVVTISPPFEAMTQKEFDAEMESVVSEIPVEFHDFVSAYAWMKGHSSGFEEVLSIASELVARLADPITAYEKSVIASQRKASKK